MRPARQRRRNNKTTKTSCRRFQARKIRAFTSLAAIRLLIFAVEAGSNSFDAAGFFSTSNASNEFVATHQTPSVSASHDTRRAK